MRNEFTEIAERAGPWYVVLPIEDDQMVTGTW